MATEWVKPMSWDNEGVEPSDNLKEKGFEAGYKPPAATFNYFLHKEQECIEQLQTEVDKKVEKVDGKGLSENDFTTAEKTKLAGVQEGAEVNQNAFSKIYVSGTPVDAKTPHGAIGISAGDNTEVVYDINSNTVYISATDTTYSEATERESGLMSAADKAKLNKASEEGHTHTLDEVGETAEKKVSRIVAATSNDGISYTATVDGITELYNGMEITIIPNMTSTSKQTTLNINGLGAKSLRVSIGGYNFGNSGTIAALDSWLGENCPVTIQYKAKFDNWQTIIPRPSVTGLYGTVDVKQGGTGATNAEKARENLGAAAKFNSLVENNEKKLTEAGFYHFAIEVIGGLHSVGLIYWDEYGCGGSFFDMSMRQYVYAVRNDGSIQILRLSATEEEPATDITAETTIYMTKIGS